MFHSLSDMKQRWEEQKETSLIHSRQDITMVNINNILKSREKSGSNNTNSNGNNISDRNPNGNNM